MIKPLRCKLVELIDGIFERVQLFEKIIPIPHPIYVIDQLSKQYGDGIGSEFCFREPNASCLPRTGLLKRWA